mmetsp:Transcript_33128/g.39668  ORF Transcript_33128/g.39668 Transcript_33128/m.39668 type:complete len:455 (+) Transcript_33128:89-1453(+)
MIVNISAGLIGCSLLLLSKSTNAFVTPSHPNQCSRPGIYVDLGSSSFKSNINALTGRKDTNLNSLVSRDNSEFSLIDRIATEVSNRVSNESTPEKFKVQLITLLRVGIPSIVSGVIAFFAFPALALFLASIMNDAGVFAVLSQDSSQFVQNFLTVSGLLFSILIGQTYAFLYQQQEAVFYALFNEVTEAKSLLEQVALVCQGRAMYTKVLESISKYVQDDLKQLQADPAVLISSRPVDDPLESIMYMTSVGVPSSVYETVRSLRQARAARLGALQRKLPRLHMLLLWILAGIELGSFPLLGAGTQTIGGYNILTVEGYLFGIMTFGIVMTMRVIGELYRPGGGAYNVDAVLAVMVKGLEEELKDRLAGGMNFVSKNMSPSPQYESPTSTSQELPIVRQGGSAEDVVYTAKRIFKWARSKKGNKNRGMETGEDTIAYNDELSALSGMEQLEEKDV